MLRNGERRVYMTDELEASSETETEDEVDHLAAVQKASTSKTRHVAHSDTQSQTESEEDELPIASSSKVPLPDDLLSPHRALLRSKGRCPCSLKLPSSAKGCIDLRKTEAELLAILSKRACRKCFTCRIHVCMGCFKDLADNKPGECCAKVQLVLCYEVSILPKRVIELMFA